MYNLNWVCFSTTVNRVWQFSSHCQQIKMKEKLRKRSQHSHALGFKTAVHTGFLGGNLGFTSGFTEAQKIIISEFVVFYPRIFSETRQETA